MPKIVERIFFITNIALKFHDDILGGRNANMVHRLIPQNRSTVSARERSLVLEQERFLDSALGGRQTVPHPEVSTYRARR